MERQKIQYKCAEWKAFAYLKNRIAIGQVMICIILWYGLYIFPPNICFFILCALRNRIFDKTLILHILKTASDFVLSFMNSKEWEKTP